MQRARSHVSLGDGNDPELLEWIRRHGNFTEWVPIILVLMALAELQGAGRNWLHIAGILLVFGRLVHPFGLFADRATTFGRIAGNSACLAVTVLALTMRRSKPQISMCTCQKVPRQKTVLLLVVH